MNEKNNIKNTVCHLGEIQARKFLIDYMGVFAAQKTWTKFD